MFELIQRIQNPWRQQLDLLIAPLAWIPPRAGQEEAGASEYTLRCRILDRHRQHTIGGRRRLFPDLQRPQPRGLEPEGQRLRQGSRPSLPGWVRLVASCWVSSMGSRLTTIGS